MARLAERERELERFQMQPKSRRHSIMNDEQLKKFHRLTVDVENDKITLRKLQELATDLKVCKLRHLSLLQTETLIQRCIFFDNRYKRAIIKRCWNHMQRQWLKKTNSSRNSRKYF